MKRSRLEGGLRFGWDDIMGDRKGRRRMVSLRVALHHTSGRGFLFSP